MTVILTSARWWTIRPSFSTWVCQFSSKHGIKHSWQMVPRDTRRLSKSECCSSFVEGGTISTRSTFVWRTLIKEIQCSLKGFFKKLIRPVRQEVFFSQYYIFREKNEENFVSNSPQSNLRQESYPTTVVIACLADSEPESDENFSWIY